MAPADQLLHRIFIALHHSFNAAVFPIAYPAGDVQCVGNQAHRFAEANILNTTGDVEVQRDQCGATGVFISVINDFLAAVGFNHGAGFFAFDAALFGGAGGLGGEAFFWHVIEFF